MNNLLFTALIIALLYYFFYYLPQQKEIEPTKLTHSIFTQTEPIQNQELTELKTKLKDYQVRIKDKESQITSLQAQIRDLAKRPVKPTNSKGIQTDDKVLEKTLDTLIKEIQTLHNSL